MSKYKVLHTAICEDCGKTFFTLTGKYCEVCRKKRRQKRKMVTKKCVRCGKETRMYNDQIMCRLCVCETLKVQDAPKAVVIGEMIRKARQTGGKLKTIENCPNFDGGKVDCVTCEPGSWKFKDCGKVITAILLMFLASLAKGYTIRATGHVVAVIIENPEIQQTVEDKQTVVYTEIGPTLQVVY